MEMMSVYGSSQTSHSSLKIDPQTGRTYHHYRKRHQSAEPCVIDDENSVGFHVDFKSSHRSPRKCVNDLRHHLQDKELDVRLDLKDSHSRSGSRRDLTADLDQVESCLEAANYMDSSLAFFYMDERDQHTVKVSELYVYDEDDVPGQAHMQGQTHEMTWDDASVQLHDYVENTIQDRLNDLKYADSMHQCFDDDILLPINRPQSKSLSRPNVSENNTAGTSSKTPLQSRSASISRLIDAL